MPNWGTVQPARKNNANATSNRLWFHCAGVEEDVG